MLLAHLPAAKPGVRSGMASSQFPSRSILVMPAKAGIQRGRGLNVKGETAALDSRFRGNEALGRGASSPGSGEPESASARKAPQRVGIARNAPAFRAVGAVRIRRGRRRRWIPAFAGTTALDRGASSPGSGRPERDIGAQMAPQRIGIARNAPAFRALGAGCPTGEAAALDSRLRGNDALDEASGRPDREPERGWPANGRCGRRANGAATHWNRSKRARAQSGLPSLRIGASIASTAWRAAATASASLPRTTIWLLNRPSLNDG